MKRLFLTKFVVVFALLAVGISVNAQIKYNERGFLTYGSTTPYNDGSKYYNLTLKGNVWVKCPENDNQFFQIDTNPAATRLASHLDQVVFYNTGSGQFNSIQVKNVYNYSDARAKTNIQPLSSSLSLVNALKPVSFTFIDSNAKSASPFTLGGNGKEIGLLAQEVEEVLPNVVLTDPEGHKLINYTALIAVLIDAVNELNAKVKALEAQ